MATFRAANTGTANSSGITNNYPAGVVAGDLLIAVVSSNSFVNPATPSGWTSRGMGVNDVHRMWVYTRIVGAETSVTFTFGSSGLARLSQVGYYDVAGDPIETVSIESHVDNDQTLPPVAVATAGGLLVGLAGANVSQPWTGPASPMTARLNVESSNLLIVAGDEPITVAGSTPARDMGTGGSQPVKIAVALRGPNTAPNAPILTAPADGAGIDRNGVNRFAWTFSDPDTGDSQSKFNLYYRLVGAPSWTTVTQTTPNSFYDMPAGTLVAGDYEWQVETYDAQGVLGARSGSSFFTAGDAPPAPAITAPINGGTVSSSETVAWSAPDEDAYELRRVRDNAGAADTATVYYDTGEVVTTTARSRPVTFETNNRYEHVQVRIKVGGLWSSWASVRVLVSFTPPSTPVVSLTADDATGSLLVGITNPAPGAGVPATAYNDVYVDDGDGEERRATMLAPNSSWTYWTPRALRDYDGAIRVVAVGSNGTTASS